MGWLDGSYSTYRDGKFISVGTIDEVCDQIKEMVMSARESRDHAISELASLKEEKWKDNELQAMKTKLDQMKEDYWRGFPISAEEAAAIRSWEDKHWTNQHQAPTTEKRLAKMGAIGGSFSYEFIPTSIGTSGLICCNTCRNKARAKAYEELYTIAKDNPKFRLADRIRELEKEYDAVFQFQELS